MNAIKILALAVLPDADEIAWVDIRSDGDHYAVMIFMKNKNTTQTFEFPDKVASITFYEMVWRRRWAACAGLSLP